MPLHTVCRTDDLEQGQMKAFAVAGENVLLYHLPTGFFATQSKCTHTFAPLAFGKIIDGCKVQCPLHRARFDIRTGAATRMPAIEPAPTYAVRVEDGDVLVEAF